MSAKKNHLTIDINSEIGDIGISFDKFSKLTEDICRQFEMDSAVICITIVNDEKIMEINRDYLNHDFPTDVISFDLSDAGGSEKQFQLIINTDEASRQSAGRGHSLEAELALYITHGMLHHLGFDDADPKDAEKMHEKEDEILQTAGFGIIYGGR